MAAVGKMFRDYRPGQAMLLLPSLDEWLPAEHLARFVDELVETHLDLSPFYAAHTNVKGFPPYEPRMMLKVLLYGYLTGVRSSRKLETPSAVVTLWVRWLLMGDVSRVSSGLARKLVPRTSEFATRQGASETSAQRGASAAPPPAPDASARDLMLHARDAGVND